MADDFQLGSGNWWRNRFESASSPSSTAMNSIGGGSFGWPTEIVDTKARSSMDSTSVSSSSIVFQDRNKLQPDDSANPGLLTDPNLQMMGLALSSQAMDWNQTLLRSEKAESGFRSMLQEDMSTNTSFQLEAGMSSTQDQWSNRHKNIYSGSSTEDSSASDFKQMNRGFSLEQQSFPSHISPSESSTVTCQGLPTSFQMDYANPSGMLQGLLGSENQAQQQSGFEINRSMNYPYQPDYGMSSSSDQPWSKFPPFLRGSPPKQPPPQNQLHFSNTAAFWNASAPAMNDVRSGFFPSLQMQLPSSNFDEKPKNTLEVREIAGTVGKKSSSETSSKRPRNETAPSPMPPFKVRKEKMGDRITALQQLVSPFGKTDTASVLSEAIEYIKFLHEQVSVLSSPYMKSGAPTQHHQQQVPEKSKDPEGPKQDLRSRGLCLVPVSSTYPVTHETTVDFWTPTFGGTFR